MNDAPIGPYEVHSERGAVSALSARRVEPFIGGLLV
jgi:hypothetical protein